MDNFLEAHNLLRMIQEEIENLKRSVMIKEVESVIKNFQHRKPRTKEAQILPNI